MRCHIEMKKKKDQHPEINNTDYFILPNDYQMVKKLSKIM